MGISADSTLDKQRMMDGWMDGIRCNTLIFKISSDFFFFSISKHKADGAKQEGPLFSYLAHQLRPVFISVHQKSRNNEFCLSGSLVVGCLDALINLDLLEIQWELKFTIQGIGQTSLISSNV